MKLHEPNPEAEQIARRLVCLRNELLRALPDEHHDVELSVLEDGDRFTVRVLWQNCILVANQSQRRRREAEPSPDDASPT